MNGTGKLLVMAVAGILIAAAIIGGVSAVSSYLNNGTSTITTHSTTTETSTIFSNSTRIETSTKISTTSIPTGNLVTQITDHLNQPLGVSHAYVTYSDIEVHTRELNVSTWLVAAPGGTVDLMSLANRSITIGNSVFASGVFDFARFSIRAGTITYYGKNVSAFVSSTSATEPILGGAKLGPNGTTGFIFDISPSIVPTESGNTTTLQLIPFARAIAIPASVPVSTYQRLGSTIELDSQPWFVSNINRLSDQITVLTALITTNAIVLVLNNTGNTNVTLSGINLLGAIVQNGNAVTTIETITSVTTITEISPSNTSNSTGTSSAVVGQVPLRGSPLSQLDSGAIPNYTSSFQTVASFLVLSNKDIVQPSLPSPQTGEQVGLVITPGEVVQLLFTGKISTLNSLFAPYSPLSIIPGGQYIIQIISPFGETDDLNTTAISPVG